MKLYMLVIFVLANLTCLPTETSHKDGYILIHEGIEPLKNLLRKTWKGSSPEEVIKIIEERKKRFNLIPGDLIVLGACFAFMHKQYAVINALKKMFDDKDFSRIMVLTLLVSIREVSSEVVENIMKLGADVNGCDDNGNTSLIAAARVGRTDIIATLLDYGASLNHIRKQDGWTVLAFAASAGKYNVVKFLLEKGATSNLIDTRGCTILERAFINNHTDCAQLLIDFGVDLKREIKLADAKDNKALVEFLIPYLTNIHREQLLLDAIIGDNKILVNSLKHNSVIL